MAALYDECIAAGLDPAVVGRIAGRISRAARDAQKLGLIVFGGSGFGSLRTIEHDGDDRALVVAMIDGGSWDGGDGGCGPSSDGLTRGEGLR